MFTHLSVRSVYSMREGAIRLDELAARTRALGMRAVALTDRDTLAGAVRFTQACQRYGIRPIYGARLTTARAPDDPQERRFVVTLLAQDQRGYENLCRIVTTAHLNGARPEGAPEGPPPGGRRSPRVSGVAGRGDPCASIEQVRAHAEGMVVLLGPDSDVGEAVRRRNGDLARARIGGWLESFGFSRTVLEVRNWLEPGDDAIVGRTLSLARHLKLRAVATNGARALERADAFLCDVLDAMRKLVPLADHHRDNRNHEATLKSRAEMAALFPGNEHLLREAFRLGEECTAELRLGEVHVPHYPAIPGRSLNEMLAQRCFEGIARRGMRYAGKTRRILDAELQMCARLGFAGYFLTIADIVARVRADGIRCACRGSAAGSLICYLTGISEVDPIEHDLVFERFMNPHRTHELPDIDVDVESARREEIYAKILGSFSPEQVACVAMVDTYRARGAIREVGKALGYPESEIGTIAKSFPHISASGIRAAFDKLPELRRTTLRHGQLEQLFDICERLDGFPRHLALHPSGILIAPDDLLTRSAMERSANGFRMSQFDKDDVEALGLLKLDVLGVRMLSTMTHATAEVARVTGEQVDLDAIPRDDPETFRLMLESRTLGCFQIESPGQRELLGKLQPTRWKDLITEISLFRPGPVRSDMIGPYLGRRHTFERPFYAHPELRPFLQETFGVIVYHEQVMRAIAAVTGCDLGYADVVRRALSDEDALPGIERWFTDAGRRNGWREGEIAAVWREVSSFAAFGFCKAHAAAFAVPTYQSAWLKANHPAAFYAGVLTHEPGMYPRRAILDDARHHGIPILPLDVSRSEHHYTVEAVGVPAGGAPAGARSGSGRRAREPSLAALARPDEPRSLRSLGSQRSASPEPARAPAPLEEQAASDVVGEQQLGVRMGLMHVEGISDAESGSILEARAVRPFEGLGDFCRRTRVSRPVVERLIHAGAFDAFGGRRDLLLKVGDFWEKRQPKPEPTQQELGVVETPESWGLRPYSDAEKVRAELEVVGMDVSRHLVSFYGPVLEAVRATRSPRLRTHRQGERVMVAGVKVASQTPAVRSGQRIIFVTLDDGAGLVDATIFESVQEQCAWTVFHSWLLVIRGTLHKTGARGVSINCERVWDLPELARAHGEGTLDVDALWTEGVAAIEAAEAERRRTRVPRRRAEVPTEINPMVPIGEREPRYRPRSGEPETMPRAPAAAAPLKKKAPTEPRRPAEDAPRKLWHASGGSAGA